MSLGAGGKIFLYVHEKTSAKPERREGREEGEGGITAFQASGVSYPTTTALARLTRIVAILLPTSNELFLFPILRLPLAGKQPEEARRWRQMPWSWGYRPL